MTLLIFSAINGEILNTCNVLLGTLVRIVLIAKFENKENGASLAPGKEAKQKLIVKPLSIARLSLWSHDSQEPISAQ